MSTLSGEIAQLSVRLPKAVRDHIRQAASANRRSMNSEVVVQLERAMSAETKTATEGQFGDQTSAAVRT